jgi:hypothetical protein
MKFDYGDSVILRQTDDSGTTVERPCEIVGITPIETEAHERNFKKPRGTVLYTVEFGDGSDQLVVESDLRPASLALHKRS